MVSMLLKIKNIKFQNVEESRKKTVISLSRSRRDRHLTVVFEREIKVYAFKY